MGLVQTRGSWGKSCNWTCLFSSPFHGPTEVNKSWDQGWKRSQYFLELSSHSSAESQGDAKPASLKPFFYKGTARAKSPIHGREMFNFVCVCLQLPSFSSSAYGFALDITSMSELLQEPLPRSLSSCIPFLPCALTKQQAPCGKSITVKSWHFLTSIAGTSHQQELSPPPRLRPKHSGPQKRGEANPSDRALRAGILDVFDSLIWVTLLRNNCLKTWTVQLPAVRSGCRHGNRSNRLIFF